MFKTMERDVIRRNPETFSYWEERHSFDDTSSQYCYEHKSAL